MLLYRPHNINLLFDEVVDTDRIGCLLLDYLDDHSIAHVKQLNHNANTALNRFLANHICEKLAIDKMNKRGKNIL